MGPSLVFQMAGQTLLTPSHFQLSSVAAFAVTAKESPRFCASAGSFGAQRHSAGHERMVTKYAAWRESGEPSLTSSVSPSPLSTPLGISDRQFSGRTMFNDASLRQVPSSTEQKYRSSVVPSQFSREGGSRGCCDLPLSCDAQSGAGLMESRGSGGASSYWEHQGGCGPVASLERSYVTDAAIGRVECNSKGCRPVFFSEEECDVSCNHWFAPELSAGESCHPGDSEPSAGLKFAPRYSQSYAALHPIDTSRAEKEHRVHQRCWYEAAVAQGPFDTALLTQYAKFAWNELRDAKKAEELFKQAIEGSPSNAEALASYALFLWGQEAKL
eukprot:TRINITY_DN35895_c0_g1_i1.p1 TRINITY_DN35895_c0_g1~~TRINITY_DN35895_c0_g1_i1.p1  ORF type:complete len:328 (-),score=22.22 TRINITY_DN35895_c0_g1_i1:27-1010(-)